MRDAVWGVHYAVALGAHGVRRLLDHSQASQKQLTGLEKMLYCALMLMLLLAVVDAIPGQDVGQNNMVQMAKLKASDATVATMPRALR